MSPQPEPCFRNPPSPTSSSHTLARSIAARVLEHPGQLEPITQPDFSKFRLPMVQRLPSHCACMSCRIPFHDTSLAVFRFRPMYVRSVIVAPSAPGHTRMLRSVQPATLFRKRRRQAVPKTTLQLRRSMVPRDPPTSPGSERIIQPQGHLNACTAHVEHRLRLWRMR